MFDYKFQDNCKLTIENENILSLKLILTNKNHKTSM